MSADPFESAALALRGLIQASPDDTVAATVRRMHAAGCSSVVVTDGHEAVGIWTAADALQLDLGDPEARNQRLESVMSRTVITLSAKATVAEARARLEEAGVRHLLVTGDDGAPVGVLGQTDLVHTSAAERVHELETDLADTRTRLHAEEEERAQILEILEATSDFVGMTDEDGNILYMNAALKSIIGERYGRLDNTLDEAHPEWAARLQREEALPAAKRAGIWQGETALLDREGREIPVSQIIVAHRRDDGEVTRFSTIMRDISAQRELEAKLRRETAFSQAMVHNVPGVFFLVDETGHLVRWNRHLEEVTGHEGNELANIPPPRAVPRGGTGAHPAQNRAGLSGG